jgi:hypothetical protein
LNILNEHPLILIAIVSVLLFSVYLKLTKNKGLRYKPVKYLNTKSEQNFFNQLQRVIPSDYYLVCKVRLADVCLPRDSKDIIAFNKVAQKHCDFVIIYKKDSKVKCAIELDDKSHLTMSAIKRDNEKDNALNSSGIPLFRIKTTRKYDLSDIKNFLDNRKFYNETKKETGIATTLNCPRCTKGIMERVNMKWPNKGSHYYECRNSICKYKTKP